MTATQSSLPASGLDQYSYDANGNLLTHTDARSKTTTFPSYDGINRPSGKTYSDSTPAVAYTYDQVSVARIRSGAIPGR